MPNDDFPCHVGANLKKFNRRYNIPVSEQKVLGLHITITKRGFNSVIQTVCFFPYQIYSLRYKRIKDLRFKDHWVKGSKNEEASVREEDLRREPWSVTQVLITNMFICLI